MNPPSGLFVSPGGQVTRLEEASPEIKREPLEEEPSTTSIAEAEEESSQGEDDDFVIDDDGVEYYRDDAFIIKQVSSPLIVNRTLLDLFDLSKGKYLKLDPEYQRDVVWDETRASALIASIIQGYFIPPIIFNLITAMEYPERGGPNKVKKYYRICVDGKQRLTSLIKFMDGRIGVFDSCHPPKKWFYTHPIVNGVEKTSNHNILPEKTRDFFRRRTFCCYEYSDLPESVEENMFQLVQRGMPLTPAEKMRALSTKWAIFAKQYEEDYAMVVNLSKQGRASGFRSVMTIFCQILEVLHPSGNKKTNREGVGQNPTLQASPQVLTRLLLDDQSLSEAVKAKFKEVFDKFQEIVNLSSKTSQISKFGYKIIPNSAFDPAPDYLRERGVGHVKTFSPLELVATAILLLTHADSRTTGMLIGDIKEMRIYLRRAHKDLRLNPACWATAWHFIEDDLIRLRGGRGAALRNGVVEHADKGDYDDEMLMQESTLAQTFASSTTANSASQPKVARTRLAEAGIQAVVESEVSGPKSFPSSTNADTKSATQLRAFQLSSIGDESDNEQAEIVNKRRKHG